MAFICSQRKVQWRAWVAMPLVCLALLLTVASAEVSAKSACDCPYANCQVGDTFTYGSYPQGEKGEIKSIEWLVLARESDRLLAIAKYALDNIPYNKECVDTNWSQCTMRSWLNGEFLHKAFRVQERRNLLEVTLDNPNSSAEWNNVPGGPDTCDKVFLLSMDEAGRYFSNNAQRCCKATAYAQKHGAFVLGTDFFEVFNMDAAYTGNCFWWLRSPGDNTDVAALVFGEGSFLSGYVDDHRGAVRPAIFLAL